MSEPGLLEHDFGFTLAGNQTLRHRFRLANPTNLPLHLIEAQALVPCCSSIGPIPESIAPGGSVDVPIELRTGGASGRKQVQFLIRTDATDRPDRWLAARVDLLAEVELVADEGTRAELGLGRPATLRYRLICRRLGKAGRTAPASVAVAPPVVARLDGPDTVRTPAEGLVEAIRGVVVDLPTESEEGEHQLTLVFRWEDGTTWTTPLAWRVAPSLRVAPTGIVLRPGDGPTEHPIVVRSDGRPFRIVEVSGPSLAEGVTASAEPAQVQSLRLKLVPPAASGKATDLKIVTDHPDQAALTLSVLTLPRSGSEAR